MMGSSVKSERQDDHEINELARKILEQNRTKLHQQQSQQQQQHLHMQQQQQMSMHPAR